MLVEYTVADGIARIVMNRPEASNALSQQMGAELTAAVARVAADPEARVLVLSGAGPRFSSGGDLADMAGAEDDRAGFVAELAAGAHELVRALEALPVPVIAQVHGAAAGIGLSFVLGADLAVAAASTKFVTAYTTVGLTPDGGMSWLLPRIVGQRAALELLLLSEPISAQRALELGIVSQVCADDELAATTDALARRLAGRPTHALAEVRQLVRRSWGQSLSEQLDLEADTISAMAGTDATGALIAGFVRK